MAWNDAPPTEAELSSLQSQPAWDSAPPSQDELKTLGLAKPSAMASGARQTLSGFAGNFDDEMSGAISAAGRVAGVKNLGTWKPLNPDSHLQYDEPTVDPEKLVEAYRENRDAARKEQQEDIQAHPAISAVASTAGMIANPLLRAASPAGMGAVQGLGNSNADLTQGDILGAAKDTALGAGTGYLAGKVADKAVEMVVPKIQSFAQNAAVKALALSKPQIQSMGVDAAKELGQTSLDEGVISANPLNNSTDAMLGRSQAMKSAGGQDMGKVYDQIDQAGASNFNPLEVATDAETQLNPQYRTQINKSEWGQLDNTIDSILARGDGTIPLTEAQGLKEEIGQVAYPKGRAPIDPTPKQQMAQDAYRIVNKAIDDAAQNGANTIGSEDLKASLQAAKDKYAAGTTMTRSLENKQAGELSQNGMYNKGFGRYLNPTKTIQSAYEDTVGSPKFMASTANSLQQVLQKSPQLFGKWAPALIKASQRGENALNAADYILQQQDPAYRQQRQKMNGSGNQ